MRQCTQIFGTIAAGEICLKHFSIKKRFSFCAVHFISLLILPPITYYYLVHVHFINEHESYYLLHKMEKTEEDFWGL